MRTKVFNGAVPKLEAVSGLGLTWDDVNVMRKLSGQPPLPDPAKSKSQRIKSGKPITVEALANSALDAIGKPLLTVSGEPKRTPSGEVRTLSASTVSAWMAVLRLLVRQLDGQDDVMKVFNDHERVIKHLEASSNTASSLSTRLHYITAISRYVPEFGRQLRAAALAAYRNRAAKARSTERDQEVDRTDDPDHAVRAFPEIAAAVPRIADKLGKHSLEHLAALLHTEITGLRDDLKGLPWYHKQEDVPDGAKNYYVADTGRVYISKFKTSQFFPPYDVRVRPAVRQTIRESLAMKLRRYLLGKATVSRLIKRAFEAVDMPTVSGVTAIRHSRISHEMRKNPAPANMKKVAEKHKHDPRTSSNYYRQTVRAAAA
eukprot:jgi/Tetstr1/454966/TSEL_041827.t1